MLSIIGLIYTLGYSTSNVIFYQINDRIGLKHDTINIEYTHDRTRFMRDTIG